MLPGLLLWLSFTACLLIGCKTAGEQAFLRQFPPARLQTWIQRAAAAVIGQLENGTQQHFTHITYTDAPRGVFVRFLKQGQERGCITFFRGVADPDQAVAVAAVDAAFFDSRYPPLRREELPDIDIEVSAVGLWQAVSGSLDFTPGFHSILVQSAAGRAVMQAQLLTERGWTKAEYLSAICRKGGMPPDAWQQAAARIFRAPTAALRRPFPLPAAAD